MLNEESIFSVVKLIADLAHVALAWGCEKYEKKSKKTWMRVHNEEKSADFQLTILMKYQIILIK